MPARTDALGRTTKWGYEKANRVTSRTLPNGESESYTWDALGNQTSHTDFTGKKTSYTVDVNGRVVFATDSTGQTTGYLYTASGQVASMSDSRGVTKYTYDAKDRLARQDNPDGTFLAYSYDANGNITQRTTPAGTVSYAYDSLNRLVSVTDTAGKQTGYQYDANGNSQPVTLNKYAYANGDPVSGTDPSGLMDATMESQQTAIVGGENIATAPLPNFGNMLARMTYRLLRAGVRILPYLLVKTCADNANNPACRSDIPVIYFGQDYLEHTIFVDEAIASGSPNVLDKSEYNDVNYSRSWYKNEPACKGITGRVSGLDCDEYPYFSTKQGGPDHYPMDVRLKAVTAWVNRGAGAKLGAFFTATGVISDAGSKSEFMVVPDTRLPLTYWTPRR